MTQRLNCTTIAPAGAKALQIGLINTFNRLDIGFRVLPAGKSVRPGGSVPFRGGHRMKSKFFWTMPTVALSLVGSWGVALADTSDVKGPAQLIVAKSGKHCKDDPNC